MLNINGKSFMNIQEAVAWLLANNALPFQCNVNYVANTEIAKTAIINPSPAEIKVGALVLFADSKVGTISGLTSNGFTVGPDYTDIKNALNYISGVAVNASAHLVITFSDGSTTDAGLIKEVSNFSINASQHLIANYNDGTSTDLGAIFSGNVNIAGNLTADSIIENMAGYNFTKYTKTNVNCNIAYAGVVKNGNKITFAIAGTFERTGSVDSGDFRLGTFEVPLAIGNKLFPLKSSWLSMTQLYMADDYNSGQNVPHLIYKSYDVNINFQVYDLNNLTANTEYTFRAEATFLLSENMAS